MICSEYFKGCLSEVRISMTFQYIQHNFISIKRSSRKFIIENRQFNLEGVIPHTLHGCRVSNLPYEGGSQTFFLLVSSLIRFETTLARTESLYYFSFILFAFDFEGPQARTQVCPTSKNSTLRHPQAWETHRGQPVVCALYC